MENLITSALPEAAPEASTLRQIIHERLQSGDIRVECVPLRCVGFDASLFRRCQLPAVAVSAGDKRKRLQAGESGSGSGDEDGGNASKRPRMMQNDSSGSKSLLDRLL